MEMFDEIIFFIIFRHCNGSWILRRLVGELFERYSFLTYCIAVSIPFFDKNNKLLQENNDGERLRVNILETPNETHNYNFLVLALLHFRTNVGETC